MDIKSLLNAGSRSSEVLNYLSECLENELDSDDFDKNGNLNKKGMTKAGLTLIAFKDEACDALERLKQKRTRALQDRRR